MTISVISASPRKNSNSIKVARYLKQLLEEKGHQVSFYDFEDFEIRSIREDYLQPDEVTARQQELLDMIETSEKVIWVVPEYNRLVPAEFVSFMTHFGAKAYPMLWNNVAYAVVGVSSGMGGRNALQYVQMVLNYMINNTQGSAIVLPYHFQSANTGEQFDGSGSFKGSDEYKSGIERFVKLVLGEEA